MLEISYESTTEFVRCTWARFIIDNADAIIDEPSWLIEVADSLNQYGYYHMPAGASADYTITASD